MQTSPPISVSGLGILSALGDDMDSHRKAILECRIPFRPLGELLGSDSPHARTPAAWIGNRSSLTHRKWAPVTMAALHVARQAVLDAGWSAQDLRDAALVVGTSRGNAAGWLSPWPGRRPFRLMAASNTIHSEPASAISIELGILGPNHVLASGCSAGLDAIGIAMMMLRSGLCSRALAVAVDLPLVPTLLDNYAASGLLGRSPSLDPYHPDTHGFIPGEGAAAMALETGPSDHRTRLLHYACNSDGVDPVGIPEDGGRTADLFRDDVMPARSIRAVCPHATGTLVQRKADPAWMRRAFPAMIPPVILLKPLIGHTIGASGMIESVVLTDALKHDFLPPNVPGLASCGMEMPDRILRGFRGQVAKVSHGMGGHNALLVLGNQH